MERLGKSFTREFTQIRDRIRIEVGRKDSQTLNSQPHQYQYFQQNDK